MLAAKLLSLLFLLSPGSDVTAMDTDSELTFKNFAVEPCNISLFSQSYVVVLGKQGVYWVDGNQTSLEALTDLIDVRVNGTEDVTDSLNLGADTAKLFYTENYSHILVTGKDRLGALQIGVLNVSSLKLSGDTGFRDIGSVLCLMYSYYKFERVADGSVENDWLWERPALVKSTTRKVKTQICDIRTLFFIPNENSFIFDDNKSMKFELKDECFQIHYKDLFYPNQCEQPGNRNMSSMNFNSSKWFEEAELEKLVRSNTPNVRLEQIADFNNGILHGHTLYSDPLKANAEPGTFFFNQLESGKFKLQAELVEAENNGTVKQYFAHVFTRLNASDPFKEEEKCYVRIFEKEQKRYPMEYPRMLIIPKESGPEGVALHTTTATTTTETSSTTTATLNPIKSTSSEFDLGEDMENNENSAPRVFHHLSEPIRVSIARTAVKKATTRSLSLFLAVLPLKALLILSV